METAMPDTIKTTYLDTEILYVEETNQWYVGKWDHHTESLVKMKEYLERKSKENFQRISIILLEQDTLLFGDITSKAESVNDYWVSLKNGTRRKLRKNFFIKDTEDNRRKIADILQKNQSIKQLFETRLDLVNSLERQFPD